MVDSLCALGGEGLDAGGAFIAGRVTFLPEGPAVLDLVGRSPAFLEALVDPSLATPCGIGYAEACVGGRPTLSLELDEALP